MTPATGKMLCDPVLESTGVLHGFGERGAQAPEFTVFPRQVHGVAVVRGEALHRVEVAAADAIFSTTPGLGVGIVTADCLAILVASGDGARVAAIHAGWRGLAAGVIEAGIAALEISPGALVAAVGPAARGCCYEVDDPVATALATPYSDLLEDLLVRSRPGRYQLDLPGVAVRVLRRIGLAEDRIGVARALCTICTPGPRFESFRRDGSRAGRLRHFIRPGSPGRQG